MTSFAVVVAVDVVVVAAAVVVAVNVVAVAVGPFLSCLLGETR